MTFDLWLDQHPIARGVILFLTFAALTAVANFCMRYDTPDDWEKAKIQHPRIAAAVAFLRAIGIDPVKAVRAIVAIIRGRWSQMIVVAIAMNAAACSTPTRAQIRSGILLTARGVVEANHACAVAVRAIGKNDVASAVKLAQTCTKISNATIEILESGERALDAADETKSLCSVSAALGSLKHLIRAAKIVADVPKSIEDALIAGEVLSALVAGKCEAK